MTPITTAKSAAEAVRLHRRAMELADEGDAARRAGDEKSARASLASALELERQAASMAAQEPSRSVLLRSAASLALELGEHRDAERLVATALAGDPPAEIAEELRDILEQVYFSRHLNLRGMELAQDEFQMSLAGDAVGFGLARSERFLKRVEDMQRLIYRTAERQTNQPFREQAVPKKAVRDELEVYVSVPRAASLAVSFRLARPRDQEKAFPSVVPQAVVAEVLTCLSLLNDGADDDVKKRFTSEAYYRNFIGLAKQIAPDGQAIKLVGFTAPVKGVEQRVEFRRRAKLIGIMREEQPSSSSVKLKGKILFADARRRKGEIQIVWKTGSQGVTVPPGMMADIVRPLWDVNVVATCVSEGGRFTLVDVRPLVE